MTLLCVDIGNTNIVLGTYDERELTAHWRIFTDHHRMPDEYGLLILNMLEHMIKTFIMVLKYMLMIILILPV